MFGASVDEGDGFRGVFNGVTTEHGAYITLMMIHLVNRNEQTKILIRTNLLRRHDQISAAINTEQVLIVSLKSEMNHDNQDKGK